MQIILSWRDFSAFRTVSEWIALMHSFWNVYIHTCVWVCVCVQGTQSPVKSKIKTKSKKLAVIWELEVSSSGNSMKLFPTSYENKTLQTSSGQKQWRSLFASFSRNLSVGQQTNANGSRGQMNCLSNIVGSINSQEQRSQRNLLISLLDSSMAVSMSLWQLNGMLCRGMPSLWLILKRRNAFIQPVWCRRWNTHNFCFSWTSIAQHKQKHEVEAFLRRISFHLRASRRERTDEEKKANARNCCLANILVVYYSVWYSFVLELSARQLWTLCFELSAVVSKNYASYVIHRQTGYTLLNSLSSFSCMLNSTRRMRCFVEMFGFTWKKRLALHRQGVSCQESCEDDFKTVIKKPRILVYYYIIAIYPVSVAHILQDSDSWNESKKILMGKNSFIVCPFVASAESAVRSCDCENIHQHYVVT